MKTNKNQNREQTSSIQTQPIRPAPNALNAPSPSPIQNRLHTPSQTPSQPSSPTPAQIATQPQSTTHTPKPIPVDPPLHPYSSLSDFTADQLIQVSTWLDQHTYHETIALIQEHFSQDISRSALARFYGKNALKEHLAATPDTAAAATEILEFAASGRPNFSAATLNVLEQTAFQLALTCHAKSSDLDTLHRLSQIITRARNTSVRERHAAVQERKCDLRREELDLKRQLTAQKHALNADPNQESEIANQKSAELLNQQSEIINQKSTTFVPPCPLPPDVIENNRRFAEKLLAGQLETESISPTQVGPACPQRAEPHPQVGPVCPQRAEPRPEVGPVCPSGPLP